MAVEFKQPGGQINVTLSAAAGYHELVAIGDYMIGITRKSGAQNEVVACDVEVLPIVRTAVSSKSQSSMRIVVRLLILSSVISSTYVNSLIVIDDGLGRCAISSNPLVANAIPVKAVFSR